MTEGMVRVLRPQMGTSHLVESALDLRAHNKVGSGVSYWRRDDVAWP